MFYVYVMLDQRKPGIWTYKNIEFRFKPFYIGIGTKYRITAHFCPYNLSKKSIKNNIIKEIYKETKCFPICYKIFEDIEEKKACEIEKDFISCFGKIKNKTGILSNLTDGGDGISGYKHTEKYKNTLRKKVYQYDLSGNFIKEWKCLKDVVDHFGLSGGNGIRISIKTGGHCKKYLWSYKKYDRLPSHIPKGTKKKYKYFIIKEDSSRVIFENINQMESFFNKKISMGNISWCATGKLKTYLGYKWGKIPIK